MKQFWILVLLFSCSSVPVNLFAQSKSLESARPQKFKKVNVWQLVWTDEFNTPGKPNAKNWNFEKGFVRNQEAQWYQPENARCENGF